MLCVSRCKLCIRRKESVVITVDTLKSPGCHCCHRDHQHRRHHLESGPDLKTQTQTQTQVQTNKPSPSKSPALADSATPRITFICPQGAHKAPPTWYFLLRVSSWDQIQVLCDVHTLGKFGLGHAGPRGAKTLSPEVWPSSSWTSSMAATSSG